MSVRKHGYKSLVCLLLCAIFVSALFITPITAASADKDEVILGGCLFGVSMITDGVPVVGLEKVETESGSCAPGYDAGLKLNDIITSINGKAPSGAKQITELVKNSGGNDMEFTVLRNGNTRSFTVTPVKAKDGDFHIGIWVRDSAAGIGTVTYIDPVTLEFAGLGHGICDADTSALLPLKRGTVSSVELQSVVKGQKGIPGELKGAFTGSKNGALIKNTLSGVYGVFCDIPKSLGQRIKLATESEVREGRASIYCNVDGSIKEYSVIITKISPSSEQGKNYQLKITDKALIEKTGGIVQGMSGSPIVQNGKLIGAVTHVTVNDPTKGYGIFIGNMMK